MCSDQHLGPCKLEGTCQHPRPVRQHAMLLCTEAVGHLLYVRVGRAVRENTALHALAANASCVALPDLVNLLVIFGHDVVKE